jgi:hypothetical protein
MRRGIVILGVVLLVAGAGLTAYGYSVSSQSLTIPLSPEAQGYNFNLLGSGSVSLNWNGGTPQTNVSFLKCSDSACSGQFVVLAKGNGSSGSISANVQAGTTYSVTETGSPAGVSATLQVTGFTYGELIGIGLLAVGVVLAIVGFRLRSKTPEPSPTGPPPPTEAQTEAKATAQAQADADTTYMAPMAAPVEAATGTRPNIKCANCGTMNEPWLTNCRWCKRTLTSTSD